MQIRNNADRANRAAEAIRIYVDDDAPEPLATSVRDLLCDVRHLCDAQAIDFDRAVKGSETMHAEEREDDS